MFSKILFLALVIGAVWFGWRWYNRIGAVGRERLRRRQGHRQGGAGSAAGAPRRSGIEAEDMEKCPECAAYVAPRSAVSCGRPACPYGR